MEIIEQFTMGKCPAKPSEDGWLVTDDFAAVVDGSTAKMKVAPGQESPGHLAMRLVCKAITALPASITKEEALKELTAVIAADTTYAGANYRPTCSAVIYSRYYRQVWFIGDCQCRYAGKTYKNDKIVDRILTDIRCDAVRYYLNQGYTVEDIRKHDKGRAFIFDALCDQLHFQNDPDPHNPFRYPVIDGHPVDATLVPVLSISQGETLILASDGYPVLQDTLQETEQTLQRLLLQDPLCIGVNPATKCFVEGNDSFDDRTYLKVHL